MIGIFIFSYDVIDLGKLNYSYNFLSLFDNKDYCKRVKVFVEKGHCEKIQDRVEFLEIVVINRTFVKKIKQKTYKHLGINYIEEFEKLISKNDIKFAIFPTPRIELVKLNIPFATSIQSLGHRLNPELRETSHDGIWKSREDIYSNICQHADLLFIDSVAGKEYIQFYYNSKSKIIVIPHSIIDKNNSNVTIKQQESILKKFNISKPFLFYPSQFWPHKNHIRILEAIILLKKKGIDIQLVYTGSSRTIRDKYGVYAILKQISKDNYLQDNLIITGFIEDDEMLTFYQNALAMIMPQLLPEPCIPFVEAMRVGCPVIGSDISGLNEQIPDAGIRVNPYSISSIAEGVELLLDSQFRQQIITSGFSKIEEIEQNKQSSLIELKNIVFK